METTTRPAPALTRDLSTELQFYRSRWSRLSAALTRLRSESWVPADSGWAGADGDPAGLARHAAPVAGINAWSAGP